MVCVVRSWLARAPTQEPAEQEPKPALYSLHFPWSKRATDDEEEAERRMMVMRRMRRNMRIKEPEIIDVESPKQRVQCSRRQNFINSGVHNFGFQSCVYTIWILQRFVGCCLEKTI